MNTPNTPNNVPTDESAEHGAIGSRSGGRRRGLAVGVAAGLLGGGLVGMAMTLPSFTNAASSTDAPGDVAPVVQVIDDGDSAAGSFDPTDRIREVLQALVDDGTITADQADAVAGHLAANAPQHRGPGGDHSGRRGPGHHSRPGFDGEVIADLLGIDAEALREAVRSGQSIAEIAEANGVDPQTVVDALVAQAQAHLDLAVENGRLTEDEAAAKAAELSERITARVNGEVPPRR